MGGTEYVAVPVPAGDLPPRIHPSLPTRPGFEVLPTAEVVKPVAPTGESGSHYCYARPLMYHPQAPTKRPTLVRPKP